MSDTHATPAGRAGRRLAGIAWFAAVYTYLLIVFGGIVRITGSGLGCGDDWPRCNGQWIPTFDLKTFIEWFHRLLAAGMVLPIGALLVLALADRKAEDAAGRRMVAPAAAAVVMLVAQALLGALTVRLELESPTVTVLHFGLANLLLALLIWSAIRARGASAAAAAGGDGAPAARKFARAATGAVVLGFLVLLMGAFTANVGKIPGAAGAGPAAWACGVVEGSFLRSFPLCNGQLFPASGGGGLVHIHWTHRLLAFLLFFHVLGAAIVAWRRGAPAPVRRTVTAALALVVAQLGVAAGLILLRLPDSLQVLHLVAGVAAWASLVWWASTARREARGAGIGVVRAGVGAPAPSHAGS